MASTHHLVSEAICLKHVFLSFILWNSKTRLLVQPLAHASYSIFAVYKFCFSSSCWVFGILYHLVQLAMFLKFCRSGSRSIFFSLTYSSPQVAPWSAQWGRPHHSFTCDSLSLWAFTHGKSAPIRGICSISWYYLGLLNPCSFFSSYQWRAP